MLEEYSGFFVTGWGGGGTAYNVLKRSGEEKRTGKQKF